MVALRGPSRSGANYKTTLTTNRGHPEIEIFNGFANCLLERALRGEGAFKRAAAFKRLFVDYDAVTLANAKTAMNEGGYRWGPERGAAVVMAAKNIATADGFTWENYIQRAEH